LDELENEIVLWDLPFKVREELYGNKGNELDLVCVQVEIEDTRSDFCSEWAYIFLERVHAREQNTKRRSDVSHHGENEANASKSNDSMDSKL
jgi:hypothetical protein